MLLSDMFLFTDDASDSIEVQKKGMESLKNKNDQKNGGRVNITLSETILEKLQYKLSYHLPRVFSSLGHFLQILKHAI